MGVKTRIEPIQSVLALAGDSPACYHQSVEDAPAERLYDWKEKAGYL